MSNFLQLTSRRFTFFILQITQLCLLGTRGRVSFAPDGRRLYTVSFAFWLVHIFAVITTIKYQHASKRWAVLQHNKPLLLGSKRFCRSHLWWHDLSRFHLLMMLWANEMDFLLTCRNRHAQIALQQNTHQKLASSICMYVYIYSLLPFLSFAVATSTMFVLRVTTQPHINGIREDITPLRLEQRTQTQTFKKRKTVHLLDSNQFEISPSLDVYKLRA